MSERAIETARRASERLTRQMLALGETAAAIEARIDEEHRDREAKESENFSRRVALLIESLNSTAIDVTKILSNEVTDSAWTAYLKGDRGVFTRRAVRLLDRNDAREIARHYEEEPEFREQVNRYIHDFEAMLRRILADRDGSPLGVTILSSDMGKLYVALAQAIERIKELAAATAAVQSSISDRHPAEKVVGVEQAEGHRRDDRRPERRAAEAEAVRRARRVAGRASRPPPPRAVRTPNGRTRNRLIVQNNM